MNCDSVQKYNVLFVLTGRNNRSFVGRIKTPTKGKRHNLLIDLLATCIEGESRLVRQSRQIIAVIFYPSRRRVNTAFNPAIMHQINENKTFNFYYLRDSNF